MITCDRCRQGFDFVSFIGGVALCKGCVKAYDTDLLRCRTKGDYERLARRVRREVLERPARARESFVGE